MLDLEWLVKRGKVRREKKARRKCDGKRERGSE
jgi:hypothetical protein